MLRTVQKAKSRLQLELGREPSVEELAEASNISLSKLRLYSTCQRMQLLPLQVLTFVHVAAGSTARIYSLEKTLDAYEKLTLADRVATEEPSPEDHTQHQFLKDHVAGLMGHMLTTREIEVLQRRYGLVGGCPQTLDEVGAAVRASRDQVRTIEARALNKLRKQANQKTSGIPAQM